MKKRALGILLVVMTAILAFTLVGCGDKDGANELRANVGVFAAGDETPATEHTVTFDPNNGEAKSTVKVADGSTVAKPDPDPTIEGGKLFRYWKTEDGSEYSFDTPVTANFELTAVYGYKVTFDAGEGTGTVDPIWKTTWPLFGIELPDGTGLTHDGGKLFAGWTYNGVEYKAGDVYKTKGNPTFTAVWKAPATEFTISFETTRYGEGTAPASQSGKHVGDEITLPENTFTAKTDYIGYVFKGWYVKGTSSTVTYQPGATYTIPSGLIDGSIVFVANWEKGEFTITYKPGDHATGADIVKKAKGGKNTLLSAYDDELTFTPESDYYLISWKKEGGTDSDVYDAGGEYMLGENTVFVAQYSRIYEGYDNIDFEQATAAIQLYLDLSRGRLYDFAEEDPIDFTFTLSGTAIAITFDGGTAVNGKFASNVLTIALPYGGKTYVFGQVPAITFNGGDGTGTPPSVTPTYDAANDQYQIELPANPYTAPAGKEFKCWSIGETEYNVGAVYSAALGATVTITAVWKVTYTVTFNSQGGSTVDSAMVEAGGKVTKPADPTKSGYVFGGWYKEEACTTAWDFATDTVTANTTLYAKWTENAVTPPTPTTYAVTFDSQGGSAVASANVTSGSAVTKPTDPTREGYTFGGWYKEAACTTAWNFETDTVTANTTLYAKWTENSTPAPAPAPSDEGDKKSGCGSSVMAETSAIVAVLMLVLAAVVVLKKKASAK